MMPRRWIMVCMTAAASLTGGASAKDAPERLPPYPLGPVVMLAAGGIVAGRVEMITPDRVVIDSLLLGRLDLPRASVIGYRGSMAVGPVPPRRLDSAAGDAAIVRLLNGDELMATALTLKAGQVTVHMATPLPQSVVIPLESVRAIDLPVVAGEPTLPRRLVALADGSRFVEASVPEVCDPADVVASLLDGDETELLARLEPLASGQGDAAATGRPTTRGSTLSGDWPSARGTTAFTGVGMQAPARVRYRLVKPARRFEALVAIDDSAGQEAGVVARVRTIDAAGVGRDVYGSPILWGGDEPHPISVELGEALELELIVDPADGNASRGGTIWLDPRVRSGSAAE